MDNTNDTTRPGPSDRMQNLEAEVEGLINLLGTVSNQMGSPEVTDPAIPTPSAPTIVARAELKSAGEMRSKIESLENQIKHLKGSHTEGVRFSDICLYPDLEYPPMFKMPKFEKYDGSGCPRAHLQLYGIMMSQYAKKEKLLIQIFPNSLKGPAATWFVQLDKADIHSWEDLANAFMSHFKFNVEMPVDWFDLQKEGMKSGEDFHTYAKRWRAKAAQVQPPLSERELISVFLSTLASPFYEHLIGVAATDFATLVQAGQRVEDGLKTGKIIDYSKFKSKVEQNSPKKQGQKIIPGSAKQKGKSVCAIEFCEKSKRRQKKEMRDQMFTPLPEPLKDLFPKLLAANLITKMPQRATPKHLPKFYDHNAHCEYHSGEVGHDENSCWPLKRRVQELIDKGLFCV